MNYFFLLFIFLFSCGETFTLQPSTILEKQPQVVATSWQEEEIQISFSQPIDLKSLNTESIGIFEIGPEVDKTMMEPDWLAKNLEHLPGTYRLENKEKDVFFHPDTPFQKEDYSLLVTPKLLSKEKIPFNQTPGEGITPYLEFFHLDQNKTAPAPENGETVSSENMISPSRPSYLMLFEIYYDAPSSDTNGDLFVELYGEPEKSVGNYAIHFVNGDDGKITDSIKIGSESKIPGNGFFVVADSRTGETGVTNIVGADWIQNFDPQNGPDCVQLVSPDGDLIDAVGYGDSMILTAKNGLNCYETWPALDVDSGTSISRTLENLDTDDNGHDWIPNFEPSPGSPDIIETADEQTE